MRKQQQIWQEEHANESTLPTMANIEPASGVVQFIKLIKTKGAKLEGRAVDIGSGKGRNSIYLASIGFEVYGLEYIQQAIDVAQNLSVERGTSANTNFKLAEIDKPWPFEDGYFDIAVDSFSSIDVETRDGRELCRDEMRRTLKPGGYALVTVCSADDEWEKELILRYPGPEKNSTLWPDNGKFQKNYDEDELREFYSNFKIVELRKIQKLTHKLGRDGTATNFWLVLQK